MSEWQETELGNIPVEWSLLTVGKLIEDGIIDKPLDGNHGEIHPKGSDFIASGIPFIMATDIKNGKLDLVNCKFISQEQADALNKGFSITGDVLLTHKASLGRTAIVGEINTAYIMLTPQVTFYRVIDKNKLNNKFLKYFFDSPVFQDTLVNHGDSGSTRAYVGITAQRDLPIVLPSVPEQKAIAAVLSSLDDKIDLLHRQNKTLEAMAETLFRQWFVEEAQEDWEDISVSDLAIHFKTNVIPANSKNELFHHYSLPAFDQGKVPTIELGSEILSNKYKVESYSILVSKLNPRVPRIWPIMELATENSICSTEFQVIVPKNKNIYGYLYYLLRSNESIDRLTMAASGTSGSHQRVRPEDILNITSRLPSIGLAEEYANFVSPGIFKVSSNLRQISTLEKIRDTLLPKLMSGDVRVTF